jgi:ribosomal-protein-alanine N-acetyltransferase
MAYWKNKLAMLEMNFSPFPVLETIRLVLRQLEITDEDDIFTLRSDESVNEFIDRPETKTKEDARQFIRKINKGIAANESLYWAITERGNNKLIGTICIWNIDKEKAVAETGYELLPSYQGKGIMKEALAKVIEYGFGQMKLKMLEAYTHPGNSRSTILLEKFNFKRRKAPADTGELIFELTSF